MKRITLAVLVLALAAVPAALADNGAPVPATAPPAAATQTPSTPADAANAQSAQQPARGGARIRARLEILRLRLRIVELRFALHCRGGVSNAPQKCVDFANKVETRLQTLDSNIQKRIQDLQACTTDGTDQKCKNADKKIALLQKIDGHVQTLIQKVQDWLNGTSTSSPAGSSDSSGSSSDSSLDQAANGLNQLSQSVGAVGSGG